MITKCFMKKIVYYIMSILFMIFWFMLRNDDAFAYYFTVWNTHTIRTNNEWDAIDTNLWWNELWDPIREWAYNVINADTGGMVVEVVNNDHYIGGHLTALSNTLQIIRNIVNWALGMLALVALIYIIIQWFMILTAAGDDSKQKKWVAGIKRACLAIAWIGLSWFIVTFIFWIIRWIASM